MNNECLSVNMTVNCQENHLNIRCLCLTRIPDKFEAFVTMFVVVITYKIIIFFANLSQYDPMHWRRKTVEITPFNDAMSLIDGPYGP